MAHRAHDRTRMSSGVGSPIVVSGLGSSGTRVIAQILQGLGVHMGDDLNKALDDLLFTLLLKRPRQLATPSVDEHMERAEELIRVFARLRCAPAEATRPGLVRELLGAAAEQAVHGIERATPARRGVWASRRLRAVWSSGRREQAGQWGFKEPTAHLFLPAMMRALPSMRYVHVMRDPRDYAAVPHNQFVLWSGGIVDLDLDGRGQNVGNQLRWWAAMNSRAIALVRDEGIPCMSLRLEELVERPHHGVETLADFVGRHPGDSRISELANLVQKPASMGRGHGLDVTRLAGPDAAARITALGYHP